MKHFSLPSKSVIFFWILFPLGIFLPFLYFASLFLLWKKLHFRPVFKLIATLFFLFSMGFFTYFATLGPKQQHQLFLRISPQRLDTFDTPILPKLSPPPLDNDFTHFYQFDYFNKNAASKYSDIVSNHIQSGKYLHLNQFAQRNWFRFTITRFAYTSVVDKPASLPHLELVLTLTLTNTGRESQDFHFAPLYVDGIKSAQQIKAEKNIYLCQTMNPDGYCRLFDSTFIPPNVTTTLGIFFHVSHTDTNPIIVMHDDEYTGDDLVYKL